MSEEEVAQKGSPGMAEHIAPLGNYRLLCLLGRGGFADVYLGEHIYLKTQAAIKVLQMRLGNDDLESFLSEARTVARLVHPHIVRVLDFGVEGSTPFLVMDYAPNGTVRQRHPKGTQLSLDTIMQYVRQIAAALQYAHDHKLIHRDVKPENLLLSSNNDILLSDFGLALVASSSRSQAIQETVGTVAYMAPEQLQGKPRPATDQYAVGVIVYEWLSGTHPFQGSLTEVASQHLLVTPAPLHEKVPGISPAIEQVVMKALEKDPHQRFATMQAFATALEEAGLAAFPYQDTVSDRAPTLMLNRPSQPGVDAPSFRQPSRLPTAMPAQSLFSTCMIPSLSQEPTSLQPAPVQGQSGTLMKPAPDQVPTLVQHHPSLPTLTVPTPDQVPVMVPEQAIHHNIVEPPLDEPSNARPSQPTLLGHEGNDTHSASSAESAYASASNESSPHAVVSEPDQATQPSLMTPSQTEARPVAKGIARRTIIVGLAGLGGLAVLGGSIALLVGHSPHSSLPSRSTTPTGLTSQAPQTPISQTTQPPVAQPTPTPDSTPTPDATANPTSTDTPGMTPTDTPTPPPVPIVSSGTGTIHGAGSFDFDQGNEVASGGDVFWDQQSDTNRSLDPVGNAQLANMGVTDFNVIDVATLQSQSYSTTPLNGNNDSSNQLVDNDVFVVLTNGDNHAKVLVTSYGYDLQIQWVTYQG